MNNSGYPQKSQKNRNTNRLKNRLSQRQRLLIGAAVSTFLVVLIVLVYQTFHTTDAKGAANGDYRTRGTGIWNGTTTWQTYSSNSWNNTSIPPSSTNGAINILSGHTVTVTANVNVDQLTVDAGGTLVVSTTKTLGVVSGTGNDVTNNGTITNSGTITLATSGVLVNNSTLTNNSVFTNSGAITNAGTFINGLTLTMNTGSSLSNSANSIYRHDQNLGAIPTATWDPTSTCEVTGITGGLPTGLNQNFGGFTWNCAGQTGTLTLATPITTQGNFTIANTSVNKLYLSNDGTSRSLTIGGNYVQTGGEFHLANSTGNNTMTVAGSFNSSAGIFVGNNSSGTATIGVTGGLNVSGTGSVILVSGTTTSKMTVAGNVSVTAGTLTLSESTGIGTLNVAGNFTHTGGTINETGTSSGEIVFNGSSMQSYTSGGTVSNAINFTVNANAYLQMNDASTIVGGTGAFMVTNGGKLGIKSTTGISSTGATGNIQVAGTRTFNTGADYTFNGTATQITGLGLPATTRNLTFDNTTGVAISNSTTVTGTLSLTSGIVTTNTKELILGSAAVGTLSRTNGYVIGNFKRWIPATTSTALEFPIGCTANYNGISLSFTTAPTAAGYIASTFTTGFPDNFGLPLTDNSVVCTTYGSGWWRLTAGNTFAGGTYTATARAEGFTGITNFNLLHLMFRPQAGSQWVTLGTHAAPTGTSSIPYVNRTGMTQLGEIGITSTSANPLPVTLVAFDVKENNGSAKITWATASESNSSYFMVQRSSNGKDFNNLTKVLAAGNSNVIKNYSTTDNNPLSGTSYYRLQQVDINGATENFSPKSFSIKSTKETIKSFSVYPNPFKSDLTMTFESLVSETMTMNIFTPQGVMVYSGPITAEKGENRIEHPALSKLMTGTYIVTLVNGETKVKQTIVKM